MSLNDLLGTGSRSLKNAVQFILDELKKDPDANVAKLISKAGQDYNLTPKQTDFLDRKKEELFNKEDEK